MVTEIADLATVKLFLRIPNSMQPNQDDAVLQILTAAAQRAVERETGRIVAFTVTAERHDGGRCELYCRELPVLYIRNIEEGWGYYNYELDDQLVNALPALSMWAFSLDNAAEGIVSRRAPGNVQVPFVRGRNNIRVDYVAGRREVPADVKLAFLELVSIWYRETQQRPGQASSGSAVFNALDTDFTRTTAISSMNLGVPDEILEMLKGDRRRPLFS